MKSSSFLLFNLEAMKKMKESANPVFGYVSKDSVAQCIKLAKKCKYSNFDKLNTCFRKCELPLQVKQEGMSDERR